jgi:hypothetical protein
VSGLNVSGARCLWFVRSASHVLKRNFVYCAFERTCLGVLHYTMDELCGSGSTGHFSP